MTVLGMVFFICGVSSFLDEHTEEEIKNFLETKWTNRETTRTGETGDPFWNNVQMEYMCCGLKSAHDYDGTVPDSCCADTLLPCTVDKAYERGCYNAVKDYYEQILVSLLASVSFVLCLICLMLIVLAQFSKKLFRLPNSFEHDNMPVS